MYVGVFSVLGVLMCGCVDPNATVWNYQWPKKLKLKFFIVLWLMYSCAAWRQLLTCHLLPPFASLYSYSWFIIIIIIIYTWTPHTCSTIGTKNSVAYSSYVWNMPLCVLHNYYTCHSPSISIYSYHHTLTLLAGTLCPYLQSDRCTGIPYPVMILVFSEIQNKYLSFRIEHTSSCRLSKLQKSCGVLHSMNSLLLLRLQR